MENISRFGNRDEQGSKSVSRLCFANESNPRKFVENLYLGIFLQEKQEILRSPIPRQNLAERNASFPGKFSILEPFPRDIERALSPESLEEIGKVFRLFEFQVTRFDS